MANNNYENSTIIGEEIIIKKANNFKDLSQMPMTNIIPEIIFENKRKNKNKLFELEAEQISDGGMTLKYNPNLTKKINNTTFTDKTDGNFIHNNIKVSINTGSKSLISAKNNTKLFTNSMDFNEKTMMGGFNEKKLNLTNVTNLTDLKGLCNTNKTFTQPGNLNLTVSNKKDSSKGSKRSHKIKRKSESDIKIEAAKLKRQYLDEMKEKNFSEKLHNKTQIINDPEENLERMKKYSSLWKVKSTIINTKTNEEIKSKKEEELERERIKAVIPVANNSNLNIIDSKPLKIMPLKNNFLIENNNQNINDMSQISNITKNSNNKKVQSKSQNHVDKLEVDNKIIHDTKRRENMNKQMTEEEKLKKLALIKQNYKYSKYNRIRKEVNKENEDFQNKNKKKIIALKNYNKLDNLLNNDELIEDENQNQQHNENHNMINEINENIENNDYNNEINEDLNGENIEPINAENENVNKSSNNVNNDDEELVNLGKDQFYEGTNNKMVLKNNYIDPKLGKQNNKKRVDQSEYIKKIQEIRRTIKNEEKEENRQNSLKSDQSKELKSDKKIENKENSKIEVDNKVIEQFDVEGNYLFSYKKSQRSPQELYEFMNIKKNQIKLKQQEDKRQQEEQYMKRFKNVMNNEILQKNLLNKIEKRKINNSSVDSPKENTKKFTKNEYFVGHSNQPAPRSMSNNAGNKFINKLLYETNDNSSIIDNEEFDKELELFNKYTNNNAPSKKTTDKIFIDKYNNDHNPNTLNKNKSSTLHPDDKKEMQVTDKKPINSMKISSEETAHFRKSSVKHNKSDLIDDKSITNWKNTDNPFKNNINNISYNSKFPEVKIDSNPINNKKEFLNLLENHKNKVEVNSLESSYSNIQPSSSKRNNEKSSHKELANKDKPKPLPLFGNKTIPEEENTIQADKIDLLEQTEKTQKISKNNNKNKDTSYNLESDQFKSKNQNEVNLSVDINSQLGNKIKNINDKIEEEIERVKRHTLNNSQNKESSNKQSSGNIIVSKSIDSPLNEKLNKLEKELTQKKFEEIMNKSRSKDASINNISKNNSNNREESNFYNNNQTDEHINEHEEQEDIYESRIKKTKESETFLTKEKINKNQAKSKSKSNSNNDIIEDSNHIEKNDQDDREDDDLDLDDAADIMQNFIMFIYDKKTQLQLENSQIETQLYFQKTKNRQINEGDLFYSKNEDVNKKSFEVNNKYNNFEIDSNNFINNEDRPLNMNELNHTKLTETGKSKNTETNLKNFDNADNNENSGDFVKSEIIKCDLDNSHTKELNSNFQSKSSDKLILNTKEGNRNTSDNEIDIRGSRPQTPSRLQLTETNIGKLNLSSKSLKSIDLKSLKQKTKESIRSKSNNNSMIESNDFNDKKEDKNYHDNNQKNDNFQNNENNENNSNKKNNVTDDIIVEDESKNYGNNYLKKSNGSENTDDKNDVIFDEKAENLNNELKNSNDQPFNYAELIQNDKYYDFSNLSDSFYCESQKYTLDSNQSEDNLNLSLNSKRLFILEIKRRQNDSEVNEIDNYRNEIFKLKPNHPKQENNENYEEIINQNVENISKNSNISDLKPNKSNDTNNNYEMNDNMENNSKISINIERETSGEQGDSNNKIEERSDTFINPNKQDEDNDNLNKIDNQIISNINEEQQNVNLSDKNNMNSSDNNIEKNDFEGYTNDKEIINQIDDLNNHFIPDKNFESRRNNNKSNRSSKNQSNSIQKSEESVDNTNNREDINNKNKFSNIDLDHLTNSHESVNKNASSSRNKKIDDDKNSLEKNRINENEENELDNKFDDNEISNNIAKSSEDFLKDSITNILKESSNVNNPNDIIYNAVDSKESYDYTKTDITAERDVNSIDWVVSLNNKSATASEKKICIEKEIDDNIDSKIDINNKAIDEKLNTIYTNNEDNQNADQIDKINLITENQIENDHIKKTPSKDNIENPEIIDNQIVKLDNQNKITEEEYSDLIDEITDELVAEIFENEIISNENIFPKRQFKLDLNHNFNDSYKYFDVNTSFNSNNTKISVRTLADEKKEISNKLYNEKIAPKLIEKIDENIKSSKFSFK